MANVTKVRYQQPEIPAWKQALGAGVQGATGAVGGYYDRQAAQQANLVKILPTLAQMKMIKPGGKQGNPNVISVGGNNFTVTNTGEDMLDKVRKQQVREYNIKFGDEAKPDAMLKSEATAAAQKSAAYQRASQDEAEGIVEQGTAVKIFKQQYANYLAGAQTGQAQSPQSGYDIANDPKYKAARKKADKEGKVIIMSPTKGVPVLVPKAEAGENQVLYGDTVKPVKRFGIPEPGGKKETQASKLQEVFTPGKTKAQGLSEPLREGSILTKGDVRQSAKQLFMEGKGQNPKQYYPWNVDSPIFQGLNALRMGGQYGLQNAIPRAPVPKAPYQLPY